MRSKSEKRRGLVDSPSPTRVAYRKQHDMRPRRRKERTSNRLSLDTTWRDSGIGIARGLKK
jgi:hypothetical protein